MTEENEARPEADPGNSHAAQSFATPAYRMDGGPGGFSEWSGMEPGVLRLADGRLSFTSEAGTAFEAPLDQIHDLSFPWINLGGVLKFRIGGGSYRIALMMNKRYRALQNAPNWKPIPRDLLEQTGLSPQDDSPGLGDARRNGHEWKRRLTAAGISSRSGWQP